MVDHIYHLTENYVRMAKFRSRLVLSNYIACNRNYQGISSNLATLLFYVLYLCKYNYVNYVNRNRIQAKEEIKILQYSSEK